MLNIYSLILNQFVLFSIITLVNVVFYFNYYYSFLATKAAKLIGRVVEILSHVDTNTLGAFIPSQWVFVYASNTGYVP